MYIERFNETLWMSSIDLVQVERAYHFRSYREEDPATRSPNYLKSTEPPRRFAAVSFSFPRAPDNVHTRRPSRSNCSPQTGSVSCKYNNLETNEHRKTKTRAICRRQCTYISIFFCSNVRCRLFRSSIELFWNFLVSSIVDVKLVCRSPKIFGDV